jgi:uncharacterized protein with von Willebrand factor type A (vWA) domain
MSISQPERTGPPGLAGEVVRFADFLKGRGFKVFQSGVHDALRSLEEIDLSKRQDFFASLRTNLINTDVEWVQFADLFEKFWHRKNNELKEHGMPHQPPEREIDKVLSGAESLSDIDAEQSAPTEDTDKREWLEGVAYSPVSTIEKKDLGNFDKGDIQVAQLALKKIMEPFRINISRRSRRSRKSGDMDFRRIMRKNLKNEGFPMELFFKEKKKRLKRLVILADVSGSMDRYAQFIMPFMLGLRGVGSRAEVFVFSTSLTPVTFIIRHLSFEKALERIAREVPEWSGGTRIGYSLHQFNQKHGHRLVSQRTVVVILSDGWDLGGKELLRREMEALARKAHTVIWLNPLAGDPDYQPVCQGMRIALSYVDYFLPADSLQSLKQVGRLLSRIMIH